MPERLLACDLAAEPPSQTLGMTKGAGASCSARNRAPSSFRSAMRSLLRLRGPRSARSGSVAQSAAVASCGRRIGTTLARAARLGALLGGALLGAAPAHAAPARGCAVHAATLPAVARLRAARLRRRFLA